MWKGTSQHTEATSLPLWCQPLTAGPEASEPALEKRAQRGKGAHGYIRESFSRMHATHRTHPKNGNTVARVHSFKTASGFTHTTHTRTWPPWGIVEIPFYLPSSTTTVDQNVFLGIYRPVSTNLYDQKHHWIPFWLIWPTGHCGINRKKWIMDIAMLGIKSLSYIDIRKGL